MPFDPRRKKFEIRATPRGPLARVVPSPCIIMGVDRNLRAPYVINWMTDVQRAITYNLSLDGVQYLDI